MFPFNDPNPGFAARDQLLETGANLTVDAPFELTDDVIFTLSLHLALAGVTFEDDDVIVGGELNAAVLLAEKLHLFAAEAAASLVLSAFVNLKTLPLG